MEDEGLQVSGLNVLRGCVVQVSVLRTDPEPKTQNPI